MSDEQNTDVFYVQTPEIALTQAEDAFAIFMPRITVTFDSGKQVEYQPRRIWVSDPGLGKFALYHVVIEDPERLGDSGGDPLPAFAETSTAKCHSRRCVYVGSISIVNPGPDNRFFNKQRWPGGYPSEFLLMFQRAN